MTMATPGPTTPSTIAPTMPGPDHPARAAEDPRLDDGSMTGSIRRFEAEAVKATQDDPGGMAAGGDSQ
jgi:hypothetical protein